MLKNCLFICRWILLVAFQFDSSTADQIQDTKYLGCAKLPTSPVCSLTNKTEEKALAGRVELAYGKAVQWLRSEVDNQRLQDDTLNAWILQSLLLSGHVNDENGVCSQTLDKLYKRNEITKVSAGNMNAGKLAILMTSLKFSCHEDKTLLPVLKRKMHAFPSGNFQNYYPYSLGMLALYAADESGIAVKFRDTLIAGALLGGGKRKNGNGGGVRKRANGKQRKKGSRKKPRKLKQQSNNVTHISDTQALALLAVRAVSLQNFQPPWVERHARLELERGVKRVDYVMMNHRSNNFITLMHHLQFIGAVDLAKKPYCKSTLEWILAQQLDSGSFGNPMATSYAIMLFAGKTLLDLKQKNNCPMQKDSGVDRAKVLKFIKDWENQVKTTTGNVKQISVTVEVKFKISGIDRRREVKVTVPENAHHLTALSAASLQDKCFKHETVTSLYGPFVTRICNVAQNHVKKAYWLIEVNGKMMKSTSYGLKDGDRLTYVYRVFDTNGH